MEERLFSEKDLFLWRVCVILLDRILLDVPGKSGRSLKYVAKEGIKHELF